MLLEQEVRVGELFRARMPDLATRDLASMTMNAHMIVLTLTSSDGH